MTEAKPTLRFDPNTHPDPSLFISSAVQRDREIAATTVLGAAFTPLIEEAYRSLITERQGHGLLIPQVPIDEREDLFKVDPNQQTLFLDTELHRILKSRQVKHKTVSTFTDPNPGFLTIDLTVGQFGASTSFALGRAVRSIYSLMPVAIDETHLREVMDKYKDTIYAHTFYANPKKTIMDSMRSTAEAFLFLTNFSEVPGYEKDPVGLFRKLIENGTFSRLGRILVNADLGSFSRKGYSPTDILDPQTLTIRKEIAEALTKRRNSKIDNFETLRNGCPVAYHNTPATDTDGKPRVIKETGIDLAAKILVEYFDHYYNLGFRKSEPLTT